jgi:hypothetical protein
MRIITFITLGLAAVALAASAATATTAGKSGFFKTQNGKIYCDWGTGVHGFVECGIKNGHLKPRPTKKCRIGDPTGGWLAFNTRGRAKVVPCSGDAGPFADPAHTVVLKAGKTWKGGGMSCSATKSSIRCKNKSGHGFNMATTGAYKTF